MSRAPRRARIVVECRTDPDDGFAYRVWSEHDGKAFGELRCNTYVEAISEFMAKSDRGDLTPMEPYGRVA